MDCLTNFSLKYAEIEDDPNFDDNFDNEISLTISSPIMFSRQSSIDSLSTPSGDGYSVQSDYSYYISSRVSPSDIPDSPSEMMPTLFRRTQLNQRKTPSQVESASDKDDGSLIDDDEHDNNLLEICLELGIQAILHPEKNNHLLSEECRDFSLLSVEDQRIDSIDKEDNLLEKCYPVVRKL